MARFGGISVKMRLRIRFKGIRLQKMKNKPKIVTLALDLYFKGVSYRKIVEHLKQFYGIKVNHVAIIKWVRKYTELMKKYVDGLMPQTGGIWHTDEMVN